MNSGIKARLDKFHLRRGMDLPQWMCNELALAQKVIVVCDETYKKKADGRLGSVGWETMIIHGDLVNLPPDSTKYQVVVRAEDINQGLPMYLTKYAFHARPSDGSDSFREELARELLDLRMSVLKSTNFQYESTQHGSPSDDEELRLLPVAELGQRLMPLLPGRSASCRWRAVDGLQWPARDHMWAVPEPEG